MSHHPYEKWEWHFRLGKADFRLGRPRPRYPDDDRSLEAARWYGYMTERAEKIMECERVRQILNP